MRKLLVVLLLAFPSGAAFASAMLVDPPAPDTHSFVTVTVGGAWPDTCVPTSVDTKIQADAITLIVRHAVTPFSGCLTVITPWQLTANLGLLPPGTYNLHGFLEEDNGHIGDLGTARFTVRPVEPFQAFPPGAPASGGTEVRLVAPLSWPSKDVVFGDAPAVTAKQFGDVLYVTAPPHAAGTVDIKVGPLMAAGAFTYYDPSAPPDPSIFETLLFPLAFTGPGAFGSSWVTDNIISAPVLDTATFFELGTVRSRLRVDQTGPAGIVLHAGRGTLGSAAVSSRIRDLSRQAESAGTQLPVVREKDWRLGTLRLTDIPHDPHFRVMLRIWADHGRPFSVSVEASVPGTSQKASVEVGLTPQGNGLLYSQMDLGALSARIPNLGPRDVKIEALAYDPDLRLFALATITNNDTQQVTAVWPQ